jgi:hypothetical protein
MVESTGHDRYVSFCGIECDTWANELMAQLKSALANEVDQQRWPQYFAKKFNEQDSMGHDNLFFIGSQMNNLYSFFEEQQDKAALELLWKLEQECC